MTTEARTNAFLFPLSVIAGLAESAGALLFARFLFGLKDLGMENAADGTSSAISVSLWAIGALAAGAAGRGTGAWARSRGREQAARESRSLFLRNFHQAPYAATCAWEPRLAARAGASAERKARYLSDSLGRGAMGAGRAVGGAAALLAMLGAPALAPVGIAVVFGVLAGWLGLRASRASRALARAQSRTQALVRESLEGWRTIRLLGRAPFVERRFQVRESELGKTMRRAERDLATARAAVFVVLSAGLVLALAITAPSRWRPVVAYLLLLPAISFGSASLARVPRWWRVWRVTRRRRAGSVTAAGASTRVTPVDWKRGKRLRLVDWHVNDAKGAAIGPLTFEAATGGIGAILTTETHAFAAALCGLAPTRGVGEWKLASGESLWRSSCDEVGISPCAAASLVEPGAPFYSGSLRDNLTLGGSDRPSDAILWESLRICGLDELARVRGGLDGDLFSTGPISAGQRILLAVARALSLKRPMLVLENPYGACSEGERARLSSALTQVKDDVAVVLIVSELPDDLVFERLLSFEDGEPSYLDVSAIS